jgi:hypothetical protein
MYQTTNEPSLLTIHQTYNRPYMTTDVMLQWFISTLSKYYFRSDREGRIWVEKSQESRRITEYFHGTCKEDHHDRQLYVKQNNCIWDM